MRRRPGSSEFQRRSRFRCHQRRTVRYRRGEDRNGVPGRTAVVGRCWRRRSRNTIRCSRPTCSSKCRGRALAGAHRGTADRCRRIWHRAFDRHARHALQPREGRRFREGQSDRRSAEARIQGQASAHRFANGFDAMSAKGWEGEAKMVDYIGKLGHQAQGILNCGGQDRVASGEFLALVLECTGGTAYVTSIYQQARARHSDRCGAASILRSADSEDMRSIGMPRFSSRSISLPSRGSA